MSSLNECQTLCLAASPPCVAVILGGDVCFLRGGVTPPDCADASWATLYVLAPSPPLSPPSLPPVPSPPLPPSTPPLPPYMPATRCSSTDRGACVAFDTYELEDGTTNGMLLAPNRSLHTFASESSGRQSVWLSDAVGQYVETTARRAANSLVLRFSIPDSADGAGTDASLSLYVDGVKRTTLSLTSHFAWSYGWGANGNYSTMNDPALGGEAHHFFDDARAPPEQVGYIPPGASVRLQVDADDAAAEYYILDLIELERVGAPLPRPAGSLSVLDFGAVAGDGLDDRAALEAAIAAAEAQMPRASVWLPPGAFHVSRKARPMDVDSIELLGAGMWHTSLHGTARFRCATNCTFSDFGIFGDEVARQPGGYHAFEGAAGRGTRLLNVWMEHTVCGYWVGPVVAGDTTALTEDLRISGCRVRNTFADGINLCNGASDTTVEHCHVYLTKARTDLRCCSARSERQV